MTYFISTSLSEAGRPRTPERQLEIDRANAELVATFAQLGHGAATPWRSLLHALHGGRRKSSASLRHAPGARPVGRVAVGPVPREGQPHDLEMSCSVASSSPNGTPEPSRR